MASMQCYKPAEQTYQEHSLGQKVSDVSSWPFKSFDQNQTAHTEIQYYSKTQYSKQGVVKTQSCCSQTEIRDPNNTVAQANGHKRLGQNIASNGTVHGKKRGEEHKRRGLLQRIKDGITGDSSGSSSSESDSDDDQSGKRNSGRTKSGSCE